MVTSGMIEKLEAQLQIDRAAIKRGESVPVRTVTSNPCPKEPPRVVYTKKIDGVAAELVATAAELIYSPGNGIYAKALRIEQVRPNRGIQSRTAEFKNPVLVQEGDILIKTPCGKGRQRFQQGEWQVFNPWLVFSGSPADRKSLSVLGVSFR